MKRILRTILFFAALSVIFSASATGQTPTHIVGNFPTTVQETPTPIPYGVKIENHIVVKWPAELIPADGRVVLEEGIVGIGERAFAETPLYHIIFPSTLRTISKEAFFGCNRLQAIVVPEGTEMMGESAFEQCHALVGVSLPSTLREIPIKAFVYCSKLKNVQLKEGLTLLGESAFNSCSSLQKITLPTSIEAIGSDAFKGCIALETIIIPEKVTELKDNIFNECTSLTNVQLPPSIKGIGRSAFYNCTSLKSIDFPTSLKTIDGLSFFGCKALTSVEIPEGLELLGASAFEECTSLTSVVLRKGFTELNAKTFKSCKALKQVVVPDGVTKLANFVFQYCTQLESVVLPATLESIGLNAFFTCSKLNKVTCNAPIPPTLMGNVFNKTPNGKALFVPAGSIEQYKATTNWGAPSFATVTSGVSHVDASTQTQQENDSRQGIYNLQGVHLSEAEVFPSLPAGIYVVNGKKLMK